MSRLEKIRSKIHALPGGEGIAVTEERGCIVLRGQVDEWKTAVKAGQLAVDKKHYLGVINDVTLRDGAAGAEGAAVTAAQETCEGSAGPAIRDEALEGLHPDVLIIGGGITGCSAARELSRWKLDILVVEKGSDVASGASKANGGVVHVGINFGKHSQKHHYNQIGNAMYGKLAEELDVPFEQKGQVMLCCGKWERIPVWFLRQNGKRLGIPGVRYLKREELLKYEPCVPDFIDGGMYMPIGGITSPYEMTIALAENAVKNGAKFAFDTVVEGMELADAADDAVNGAADHAAHGEADRGKGDGKAHVVCVKTNRGRIYPKLIINAAGVHADEIAGMAGDRTFTIHPRRGTDIITDKKAGYMVKTSMAKAPFSILPQDMEAGKGGPIAKMRLLINAFNGSSHTKGVGLIHSIHGNMLIGPNAIETPNREDKATYRDEVEAIIEMQQKLAPDLKASDVIAYFTGVRAPTYEEDFVVRKGIFTDNILEAAGIQSPGVTAAPAIGIDLAKWAVEYLNGLADGAAAAPAGAAAGEGSARANAEKTAAPASAAERTETPARVEKNENFDPVRKAPPRLRDMDDEVRDQLIRENPDYGIIVCRCEEISKGEILDALKSGLCVPTLDGIKRRLRPGMGRCQGGFCSPLVMEIIAEYLGVPLSEVRKSTPGSVITYGEMKGGVDREA